MPEFPPAARIHDLYRLGDRAAEPRTLRDVFLASAAAHPDAVAIDDGDVPLTYQQTAALVRRNAAVLAGTGIGAGSRVGIRMTSGTRALYLAILTTLFAGAAYVPVDIDDPPERADLVFAEADVDAIITDEGIFRARDGKPTEAVVPTPANLTRAPVVTDDAWIIFTSGSTGTPKGVAVTHRSAAAFVDAEAQLFLVDDPLGPEDRVLAGLSVAFDASCEEMWLAWRHGATLVPAPRDLVRSGMDLGPWLVRRSVTVISTVPTLASLWPPQALESVRLLIFGGEACPPELGQRLAVDGREVWNTYGPTEATVVACAAPLDGSVPVRIGHPLLGWDLAVVDENEKEVGWGETGQLVIGGVGLARYLDPTKDAEKYAAMPTLGWERAYRSGDLVRLDPEGLVFAGRADDQVKVGGRRIELGEIDTALQNLPGVSGAAAAVRTTAAGNQLLVGYLVSTDPGFDVAAAHASLSRQLPAPMVPRLALVDDLPTRVSGKVDRNALPWPLPGAAADDEGSGADLTETQRWLAAAWESVLGVSVTNVDADFFAEGGGSLAAAQLVSALRSRYPSVTVGDLYDNPRLGRLAQLLDSWRPEETVVERTVAPTPRRAGLAQTVASIPLATLTGMQWITWLAIVNNVGAHLRPDIDWLFGVDWWVLLGGFLVFITPLGRMTYAALFARILLRGVRSGVYPRGGSVHIRLWCAERLVEASGASNISGAPWMIHFARALGASVGRGVDLHTLPPVTGLLTIGDGASVEPEVDLAGWWIDGDEVRIGAIVIKPGATIGARSTLFPDTVIGRDAVVEPGSAVRKRVRAGQQWAGSPAKKVGAASHPWPEQRPDRRTRWAIVYGLSAFVLAAMPLVSLGAGLALLAWGVADCARLRDVGLRAALLVPPAAVISLLTYAVITAVLVRLLSIGITAGYHPVRSRVGWQVWLTERVLDAARTYLFILYASLLTPVWFRILGAKVGRNTEISTALVLPKFTTIDDGAFLADDTMVASYELGGGWLRVDEARIGKRAFLGNSGITGPGRKVPKNGLVAVLSATPSKAKSGSSWLGSPPVRLRRVANDIDASRTFAPSKRLRVARAVIETLRIIPVMISFGIGAGVLLGAQYLAVHAGLWVAAACSGLLLLLAGAAACCIAAAAKWLVVGRIRVSEHPLWSSFVWRNELSDAFVETVAAPWFANAATGTPVLTIWLRLLGARIGRGVWCETYWLPEADLVTLADGATVQRGCVVQTHLFHDRVMAIDTVELDSGATLGPHCVALPASRIGASATVGPASLVMRGDAVPAHTRWQGNPIAPWG
ncbi:amino acid adenylation domain-containing protein [Gordonia sp. X0973]|uniref:Pls/PosA family non-ribosomal peptide synthetase n=1 Tax=Gordonia sp. X0973 TaxID=2742602 RepID=UPI0015828A52|nr:Pls/PosA family non-ribosomal peptide synthetase [Gordonia sp. X0973]QKT06088.1 amino acid adenylation domain-containing protein [Gordonia sp. X0973]